MSIRSKIGWLVAIVVIGASGLKADQIKLTFTGVVNTNNTMYIQTSSGAVEDVYIDPYTGTIAPVPPQSGPTQNVTIYCVDPDHNVTTGNNWTANRVYLASNADLSSTFQYQKWLQLDGGDTTKANADAYVTYSEMAWLIQELNAYTGNLTVQQSIQLAIWNLADGKVTTATGHTDGSNYAYWESAAVDQTESGFYILTDAGGTYQEYMITTPEAGTLLLLGIGLLSLMGVAFRRGVKNGVCAI